MKMRTMAIARLVVLILALERRFLLCLLFTGKSACIRYIQVYFVTENKSHPFTGHCNPDLTNDMAVERDEDDERDDEDDDGHPTEVYLAPD